MFRFSLVLVLVGVAGSISLAQPPTRHRTMAEYMRDHRNARLVASMSKDTIPIGRFKYFQVDSARYKIYLNTVINKDSVKLLKANAQDWAEYASAHESLKKVLTTNLFNNVQNYIDTVNDFNELRLVNQQFLPYTAKVCLRQLTFNINLLNQLLAKPLNGNADLQLLNSVMKNIEVLVALYIAPIGKTFTNTALILLPSVRFRVLGKDGVELNNVQCYFISNKTCRDIACMTCLPALNPCEAGNISSIISKADITYDCANPGSIKVNYGHYHLFVISFNKILFSDMRHFDENTIPALDNNEIKIILQ